MNKTDRFRLLLDRGYFPEELPPPFHTSDLAKYRASVSAAWNSLSNTYPSSTPEIYSNPRIRRLRRNLSIINPVPQLFLCNVISDCWVEIRRYLRRSRYSLEVPEIEDDKERAISPPDFGLISIRKIEIAASFDHALLSDISRFYGTLYTHAIPWALHGKEWCKRNLHTAAYNATLGNRLDVAVRKGQDNQTIGIPVGPDTSRILSEIVGSAIDAKVQQILNLDRTRAFRNIDDWYIGFDNAGDAEDAISKLAVSCRDFELELNAEKTCTVHASANVEDLWPSDLREHRFVSRPGDQTRSLEHYFAKAFQFANQHRDQNILDYAVKRTRMFRVGKRNWRLYESFLLKAVRANSTVTPTVVQILVSCNFNGYDLDRNRIKKLIEDLIRQNAPLAYHAEVAWALFLAKALRIRLSQHGAQAVSQLENSVCALLALDLRENGLVPNGLDTRLWALSMSAQGLWSHMWLLAYEADLKGWLQGTPPSFVDLDPYFTLLKAKKISFYDIKKNVKHISREKPRPRSTAFLEFLRTTRMELPASLSGMSMITYG